MNCLDYKLYNKLHQNLKIQHYLHLHNKHSAITFYSLHEIEILVTLWMSGV